MNHDILLVDLGSVYWRHWFSTRSQFAAFDSTINDLDWHATEYQAVIVCADSPRNWRHDLTESLDKEKRYKANRPPKAQEAVVVLVDLQQKLAELGYPVALCDGYEADDVIATLAKQASPREVDILSEDKDLYQLISSTVRIKTRAGVMTVDECLRKFGVGPAQMRDLLAIIGDSSDNIDGCPKVGPMKAAALLAAFGNIDAICAADPDDLSAIKGIGNTIAASIAWWDPTLATQLVSLTFDCPVSIDELLRKYTAPDHFTTAINDRIAV